MVLSIADPLLLMKNMVIIGNGMKYIRDYFTQREGLCVISNSYRGIMVEVTNFNIEWKKPLSYHKFCICHLASNVNNKFMNACVKNLYGKATDAQREEV